ncbi:MAG: LptF/LptG family permease [Candidatus Marinarcus sp.]|uniref:LptF/LptG family permease n=1 Tax=Candidatus Marinarcus sp. TaxID=3100987 RepID=UPI003B00F816
MNLLTKYLLTKYLKSFIIVFISLELFFVGIDFLQNFRAIPNSANLQLLYLLYNAFFTLTLTLPLSLVFGWILTLIIFVKNNEFVAFLSLGTKPKAIYMPTILTSLALLITLIVLQSTPLAYAYEQKVKIMDGEYFTNTKTDIFLKYDNYFVYFKKLYPLEKRAEEIHIFKIKNEDIVETIVAKKAYFQNNKWYVLDAKVTKKPEVLDWNSSKIVVTDEKFLNTLEGFKPKILDTVYESTSNFSIVDAVYALVLLNSQNVNTQTIRASLYYQLFTPFFILPVIMIIFSFASINSRFFNIGQFSSLSVFFTLTIWGLFFMLHKFSKGGIVIPEIAIILPLLLWFLISYIIFKKRENSY